MTTATPRMHSGAPSDTGRWRQLGIISLAELLALAPWFGASAVAPNLVETWALDGLDLPILTVAVQLGFVVGAILLALTGAADKDWLDPMEAGPRYVESYSSLHRLIRERR